VSASLTIVSIIPGYEWELQSFHCSDGHCSVGVSESLNHCINYSGVWMGVVIITLWWWTLFCRSEWITDHCIKYSWLWMGVV